MGLHAIRAASDALLARRRDQRGFRTLGDDHDRALVSALLGAAPDAAVLAEADRVGEALGRDVYARRLFEDDLAGATAVLAKCLEESGLGTLRLETQFHRTAVLRYAVPHAPALALVTGATRGFFGYAFNCHVQVEPSGDAIHLRLLEGRDVNRGSSA